MINFSELVIESRKLYDSETLLNAEVSRFVSKVNKIIPIAVKDAIFLTQKYNLMSRESIEEIRQASKSLLKKLAKKYDISEDQMDNLYKTLKDLKQNINLLPQYMSAHEREMMELGKLAMSDLTIDLETTQGRSAATKMYMPLVYKIVNQYVNASGLSRSELISAGTEGFVNAMNQWDRSTGVPFKTYAGTRVRQQILNDINAHSHSLSGFNDYARQKGWSADALSLDQMLSGDEEFQQDRLSALGTMDDEYSELDEKKFKVIYELIEGKFSTRDVDIFYRLFSLKGNKKETAREIAKSYGIHETVVSSIKSRILKFLRNDPQAMSILKSLHESYNVSLMIQLCGADRNIIMENLVNDDLFILLEELNKWADKNAFTFALNNALGKLNKADSNVIKNIVSGDFDYLDSVFKKHKKIIILFLSMMHPTESMTTKTDVSLLEYMSEIQEAYQKHIG